MRDWAREEQLEPYDQEIGSGYLRHLVVREGRNTGQALVVLVTAPGERFEAGYFVDVLRRFPEVRSIHWAINDTPAEQTNLPTKLLWGEDAIEEEILGLRFRVRPSAFLQTNTEMAARLYELAREYAGLTGDENVFDLYCGTGTIGLALAASARSVWGLEISEESVACAIENAELNGIENAHFFAGQRRPDDRGAPRGGGQPGRRGRRSSARRARGQGAATDRRARARRGSSTSPATRPRSRPTSRCFATSTATCSSAAARSTCSRTRRTSSRSPSSTCLARPGSGAPDVAPEQVGVRQHEAEADRRERGKARDAVPRPDEHERRREARASSRARSQRPGAGSGRLRRGRARRR